MTSAPIRVIAGSPTDEETAAIAALFTQLLLERQLAAAPLEDERPRSRWNRSGSGVAPDSWTGR